MLTLRQGFISFLAMSDLLMESKSNEPVILSIEQLNLSVKQILEGQIGQLWVRGEISNFKAHSSGHFYFSLKDAKSQVSAVMFRGNNARLKFKPVDGLEVIARGRISVYEPRGNYQIVCDMMEPVGAGALQKAFEQLKMKLKAEGLFESSRKRPIPPYPRHIAIVTSPTGAAIRDILNILSRRAKGVEVTLVPTIVQGDLAAASISEALKKAFLLAPDVIIVGRGGGSIEDMWCFNDEALARLIVASPIPIISAVGHEIDFTIADFVADLRAPTPSAAAELVAKSSMETSHRLVSFERLLTLSLQRILKSSKEKAYNLSKRLVDPQRRLQDLRLRNDDLLNRLEMAVRHQIAEARHGLRFLREKMGSPQALLQEKKKEIDFLAIRNEQGLKKMLDKKSYELSGSISMLESLSPLKVVERGYAIVTKDNEVIKSAQQVGPGDVIELRLAKGRINASVNFIENESK